MPDSAGEAARAVADALEHAGIAYAIGGALAYGFWGVPRDTVDVDVTVFLPEWEAPRAFASLRAAGCTLDEGEATRAIAERGGSPRSHVVPRT